MHQLLENVEIKFDLSPLIKAINSNSAVVYVGAGASIPAGLPGWRDFLEECIDRSWGSKEGGLKWDLPRNLLKEGEYLTCAELLQMEIGQSLEQYIWDIYGHASSPSEIHKAIARVPFSLALTTNYDRLLESSYPFTPNVWTWRDPQAVFSALKNNRFAILKIHGDVGNGPSLVLTRTQYRDFTHLNKSLNDCLTTLLSLKTFLFVGSSLRDQNILSLMDDARLTHQEAFGPHYAILNTDKIDQTYTRFLKEAYNINVIGYSKPENPTGDWRTKAVCSFLKVLSGKTAGSNKKEEQVLALDSPTFNLREMARSVITDIVKLTGSDRGQIAFVEDINHHGLSKIVEVNRFDIKAAQDSSIRREDKSASTSKNTLILPDSLLGSLFLTGTPENGHVYISDVENMEVKMGQIDAETFKYHQQVHSNVKSILACQIRADGQRVGVLSIESFSTDAFTPDHLEALKKASIYAGAAFTECRHRKLSSQGIEPFFDKMHMFQELMDLSRQLYPLNLSYLLYKIDYSKGTAIPYYDRKKLGIDPDKRPFQYNFGEESLVTSIIRSREERFIRDVTKDLNSETSLVAKRGVDFFKISGPLYGVPIRVNGHTSSILVVWSRDANVKLIGLKDRISRLAHLIANAPDRDLEGEIIKRISFKFLKNFNENLEKIDGNLNWSMSQLKDPSFRTDLIQAMFKSLTENPCGIARIRLWQQKEAVSSPEAFECIYSYTKKKATVVGKSRINAYVGASTDISDPYCRYTVARAGRNPYALRQHPSMFGQQDKNARELDKDPEGSWIVCPIYRGGRLLGFISADNHYPAPDSDNTSKRKFIEIRPSERLQVFQRLAIDLVADLIVGVLIFQNA